MKIMKAASVSIRALARLALVVSALPYVYGQSFPQPQCTRVSSPPPDSSGRPAICGQKGNIGTKQNFFNSQQTADNLQQCQNLCLRRQEVQSSPGSGCSRFSYNSKTKRCTLQGYPPAFAPNATSPTTVYDARCFSCSVCPAPLGHNLIDVPMFESVGPLAGPWEFADYIKTSVVSPGYNSNKALYSTCDGAGENGGNAGCPDGWFVYQEYNACGGSLFLVEFDYKAAYDSRVDPNMHVGLDSVEVYLDKADLPNNQWRHFKGYGDTFGAAGRSVGSLSLFLYDRNWFNGGHYGVYFDNVSVTPIRKNLTIPTSSAQRLPNAGFELGNLGPWNLNPGFLSSFAVNQPGVNSKYAFRASASGYGTADLSQASPKLVVGAEYVLSVDFNAPNDTSFIIDLDHQATFGYGCTAGVQCNGSLQWLLVGRQSTQNATFNLGAGFGIPVDGITRNITLDNISIKRLD